MPIPVFLPQDNCAPCRDCYGRALKTIVKSPIIAGLCMGIPTYIILSGLGWMGSVFGMMYMNVNAGVMSSYYAILGLTVAFWFAELASIYYSMPNVMALCGFCHAAIGSWWLVNFFILLFVGWRYIPMSSIFLSLIGVLTPAIIWHMTGDIIRAYKRKLIEEIAEVNTVRPALALASAYVDVGDLGNSKV